MQKTIIITGASSGIGRAFAEHLAILGHKIIAVGRCKSALEELKTHYPATIRTVIVDLTKKNDYKKIKKALDPKEQGVLLVNNAAIVIPQLLTDISEETWDLHFLTNVKPAVFLTKLLLFHLKGGRVLNVSTGLARNVLTAFSAYGVSKAALYMWKEYSNAELNDKDVLFGSAMPGIVDTPIQENIRSHDQKKIPSVNLFHGFLERHELLKPGTVAKFLSWLLLKTNKDEFIKSDWNIYDTSHHEYWADPGEIKQRTS